jgi:hypothetical protein
MEEVRCAICGQSKNRRKMIRRRLNGRDQYCCSIACEVKWEKSNMVGVCG